MASAYVVEQGLGLGSALLSTTEVYRGPDLEYELPAGTFSQAFRVKATEGVFSQDSPWSNIVEPFRLFPIESTSESDVPAPPSLTIKRGALVWQISWTRVAGATSYVLEQRQLTASLFDEDAWASVYEGAETEWQDYIAPTSIATSTYRVKAVGPWGETAWGF
jgi:hypothetical protein